MKRLLYIAHRVPYPPDKGERVRAFHEIKTLSEHFRITLAALAHSKEDREAVASLREWCHRVLVASAGGRLGLVRGALSLLAGGSITKGYFHSRHLRKLIAAEAAREPFDLVMGYSSSTLPYVLAAPAPARVIDLVDVDSAKWFSYADAARWPKRWLYRREAAGVRHLERQAVEHCDAVLLVSQAESAALGCSSDKVVAVGNGVDTACFAPDAVPPADIGPASLVFTGTMDYRPNIEAVCWFARHVWPNLQRAVPELTFIIVGRSPSRDVRQLSKLTGVTVIGTVPDVRPYLAAASVAICPLQIARGVQNKTLEAMAMGRAVIASSSALEGLDVEIGEDVLRADTPAEWRSTTRALLGDSRLRDRLGRSARAGVEARYQWPARMEPLVSLCVRISKAFSAPRPAKSSVRPENRQTVEAALAAKEGLRK